ncbi:hypothetical protein HHI36_001274 [Cryptolaemus montrouzieri]|uniref:Uncharacterized protein n=1 Tax=Cryptolaemus montrouzieri TaxID=559131 RepID=A0ABD2P7I2_9CUCU
MNGKQNRLSITALEANGNVITSNQDVVNIIEANIRHKTNNDSTGGTQICSTHPTLGEWGAMKSTILFSQQELNPDDMPFILLKHLSSIAQRKLLDIYNQI